ncbi:MAG: TlpA family protein disulfide reductase [Flavobacteriaceae bacterium]
MKKVLYIFIVIAFVSCDKNKLPKSLEVGIYRVSLAIQDNEELPFIMKVTSPNSLEVYNAEEVIQVDEITYRNDSVYIQTPVFEGYIAAKITTNGFEGSFIKESLDRIVPVKAEKNNNTRFPIVKNKTPVNMSGVWETVFSQDSKEDRYIAKGTFQQDGQHLTGTFRTTTGDYRYLEGVVNGNTFKLSTFDGAHAFLFTGTITDNTLNGFFYSGDHWKEPFTAKKNATYELPHEDTLTYIKDGYNGLEFSFPDIDGNLFSLKDRRFQDKVVIVQIMGTWCPNCLDESKYYTQYYQNNKDKGIEFIALAFEVAKTKEVAFQRIDRLKKRLHIEYPIVLAQYGNTADKKLAQEKLPMLNHIISYPTSIFIDKKGNVRKIHTGFNGPATGQKYLDFKKEFENFVAELLKE